MLLEAAVSVSDAHPSSGIDELEVVRALVGADPGARLRG